MFAALKNSRSEARLLYSDYCAFSAQKRYSEYDSMRVQMYKIHKPHLDSGYLKSVAIDPARDAEGQPDWAMLYVPGPRARAEFLSFTRKQNPPQGTAPRDSEEQERRVAHKTPAAEA